MELLQPHISTSSHALSLCSLCCALHPYEFNPPLQRRQQTLPGPSWARTQGQTEHLQDGRTNAVLLHANSPDLHLHHFLTSPVGRSKLQPPPKLRRVKNLDIYMFRERFNDLDLNPNPHDAGSNLFPLFSVKQSAQTYRHTLQKKTFSVLLFLHSRIPNEKNKINRNLHNEKPKLFCYLTFIWLYVSNR